MVIKRDTTPIYHADWKSLIKVKTSFLLVHARKSYPWKKNKRDTHPINVNEEYIITHNGTIKNSSFPEVKDPKLKNIANKTSMDTRKYLWCIIDNLKQSLNLKEAIESVLRNLKLGLGANAFLFNSKERNIVKY